MIAIVALRKAERKNHIVHIVRMAVDWIYNAMAIVAVRKAVITYNNVVHIVRMAVVIVAVVSRHKVAAIMHPRPGAKYSASNG